MKFRQDSDFVDLEEAAKNTYVEALESEADRRGVEGVDDPVYYDGEVVGHKKKYSDPLLMFRLKKLDPDGYRERTDNRHQVDLKLAVHVYIPDTKRDPEIIEG